MKNLVIILTLVVGMSVGLNAENLSEKEVKNLLNECLKTPSESSCQKVREYGSKLIQNGVNIEQCNKSTCFIIGIGYLATTDKSQESLKYFNKACTLNDAIGCLMISGLSKDLSKAYEFAGKACELKFDDNAAFKLNEVCYDLGAEYHNGNEIKQDYSKAAHYYQIACEAKNADGCYRLGVLYEKGNGVEKNFVKAREYYKSACDLKHANGCNNLGVLYENGQGVRLDFTKASQYYKIACDLKNTYGCNNLGWLYYGGKGVKANDNKAKELFGKACDLGSQDGCDNYKEIVSPPPPKKTDTISPSRKRAIEEMCDDYIITDCDKKYEWYDPTQRTQRLMLRKMEENKGIYILN